MDTTTAARLSEMMRNSYNAVAKEFSASRTRFFPELAFLAEHATPGGKVLDIGCGNGLLYPLMKERMVDYTGLDYSKGLLAEARRLHPFATFMEGDATAMPFADETFDAAFSFATLHHLPGKAIREQSVRETARVLKNGGVFVLSVWYLWQLADMSKYLWPLIRNMLPFSPLDPGDMITPFFNGKGMRYLHAFTTSELRHLLEQNGFAITGIEIIPRGTTRKNIVAVARKIQKTPNGIGV